MTRSRHDVIEMEEMAAYATTVIPNSEKNNKKYKSSSSVESKASVDVSTKGSVDGLTRGTGIKLNPNKLITVYPQRIQITSVRVRYHT